MKIKCILKWTRKINNRKNSKQNSKNKTLFIFQMN